MSLVREDSPILAARAATATRDDHAAAKIGTVAVSCSASLPDDSNPFATRFTRPGALPYVFEADETAAHLVERLDGFGWRGEIVGPHGTGKSTLLATLMPLLKTRGLAVLDVALRGGQRRLPADFWQRGRKLQRPAILVIDGFEQLRWLGRWRLRRGALKSGLGLLVTSHQSVGLPRLVTTAVSAVLAERIVERLVGDAVGAADRNDLARRLADHEGNLREVLMDLYDVYERRRAGPA